MFRPGRPFNDLQVTPQGLRRRFERRGLVFDQTEQLARAIATGLNLDWWALGADSQLLMRQVATEILARFGRGADA